MGYNSVTYTAYLSAGVLWAALSCIYLYRYKYKASHWTLAFAGLINAVWLFTIAGDNKWVSLSLNSLLAAEISHYGIWIFSLIALLKFFSGTQIPAVLKNLSYSSLLIAAAVGIYALAHKFPPAVHTAIMILLGLFLSIVGLIGVEQLYKNNSKNRQIKLLSLNLGAIFIYDIYLYAHSLIFNIIDGELWQGRAVVAGATALLLTIGEVTPKKKMSRSIPALSISRPIVFYTTSLTVAGCVITVLALGGYYVKHYGGDWGTAIYTLILFFTLMGIAVSFASTTSRALLSVLISKHLFRHKYDYRKEWLSLINQLSQPASPKDIHQRTIKAVATTFKSPGGAIWLRQGQMMTPICDYGLEVNFDLPAEPISTAFCYTLRDEWVFAPHSKDHTTRGQYNEYLPTWIKRIPNLWIIFPLLIERELIGFMILAKPTVDSSLTWEDLDLLKTVGRQVASTLERHKQSEQLTQSRQFDTFNKLSAFIMHDLKNLIAQQALVVRNATKHRDNPAFFEDAICTIDNSVSRMNDLLRKLQRNEPEEIRNLSIKDIVIEAVKKCQDEKPVPTLRLGDSDSKINADQDRLVMTLTHLIKNAQDATPTSGFIDVTLHNEDKTAIITIEDNGSGMDEDFVRDRLFKPFETTKSGKGMGIGVFQAREHIVSLGGTLKVASTPEEGSTFTITLSAIKAS